MAVSLSAGHAPPALPPQQLSQRSSGHMQGTTGTGQYYTENMIAIVVQNYTNIHDSSTKKKKKIDLSSS